MNSTATIRQESAAIAAQYASGVSTNKLAVKYQTYPTVINRILRECDLTVRTMVPRSRPMSDQLMRKLDGWMLGDGNLTFTGRQAHFQLSSKHEMYADFVRRQFESELIECKKYEVFDKTYRKTAWKLRSLNTIELEREYRRWYIDGKKRIPNDLKLTSDAFKVWIMDDGTLDRKAGHMRMCTNGFSPEECEFLADLVNRFLDVDCVHVCERGKNTTRLYIPKVAVHTLLAKIGSCDVNCFTYKWAVKR